MKTRVLVPILIGIMVLLLFGCGNKSEAEIENIEPEIRQEEQIREDAKKETVQEEEPAEEKVKQRENDREGDEFSFEDLKYIDFYFATGTGGWETIIRIKPDGSFYGEYHDMEYNLIGDDYPNGTMFQSNFTGQFTQPVKINDYTYSIRISELNYEKEFDTQEIVGGLQYYYTYALGVENSEEILIYLPGTPVSELSDLFLYWMHYANNYTELPFYALKTFYEEDENEDGFIGYNIFEVLRENVSSTEGWVGSIEESIKNDPLTQEELTNKTQQLYELWDYILNELWDVLPRVLDEEVMAKLSEEQREWIALKEETLAEIAAEYEGDSMMSIAVNQKAAEITKERVYELLELLDQKE